MSLIGRKPTRRDDSASTDAAALAAIALGRARTDHRARRGAVGCIALKDL